jgi:septal ring factor EnvC (AmiA/AmiB activator)
MMNAKQKRGMRRQMLEQLKDFTSDDYVAQMKELSADFRREQVENENLNNSLGKMEDENEKLRAQITALKAKVTNLEEELEQLY